MTENEPCPQCGCEMRMVSDTEKGTVTVVYYCPSCGYAEEEPPKA